MAQLVTLEKVGESGIFTVGFREDAAPFSMMRPDGQADGYSVQLCIEIAKAVAAELGRDEIQVDFNSKKNPTGSVYNLSPATNVVGEEENWNRMEIECRGPVIKVWVNGELVNQFTDAKVAAMISFSGPSSAFFSGTIVRPSGRKSMPDPVAAGCWPLISGGKASLSSVMLRVVISLPKTA